MTPKALAKHYYDLFTTPAGKVVLDDLRQAHDGQTYTQGDTHETAYREGQRRAYRRIANLIEDARSGRTDARRAEPADEPPDPE